MSGSSSMSLCDRVDETIADVLDGTAAAEVLEHLATCDRCRDIRHETACAMEILEHASSDYVPPKDLTERLMTALDARGESAVSKIVAKDEKGPNEKNHEKNDEKNDEQKERSGDVGQRRRA